MARFLLLLALFVVIAKVFWRFVDAIVRGAAGPASQGGGTRSGSGAAVKMSQCPVCGTYVVPGKAISIVSAGSPVYFDSEKCRAEFESR
jgi:YHS domain-containing protein